MSPTTAITKLHSLCMLKDFNCKVDEEGKGEWDGSNEITDRRPQASFRCTADGVTWWRTTVIKTSHENEIVWMGMGRKCCKRLLTPARRKDETNCCMHNSFIASTSLTKACACVARLLCWRLFKGNFTQFYINFLWHSALERRQKNGKALKPKHMLETLACEGIKSYFKSSKRKILLIQFPLRSTGETLHGDTESGWEKLIQPVASTVEFFVELIKQISMAIKNETSPGRKEKSTSSTIVLMTWQHAFYAVSSQH